MTLIFLLLTIIRGEIYDTTNNKPLRSVHLSILGTPYGCITDREGKFFLKIPEGEYTIKITHIGYKEKNLNIKVSSNQELKLRIFLKKSPIKFEPLKIIGKHIFEPSFRIIEAKELKFIPLADKDFFRTVKTFPGVTSVSDLIGWLYIRGGMPRENLYLMDGGEILCPHHYFGIVSVFNVNLLKDVKFSCGGFSSRYGDRLSAVLDVTTRDGNYTKRETIVEADLIEVSGKVEVPLSSNFSYIFSGRRNYLATVAPLFGIEKDIVLPSYQNFQNRVSLVASENHKFSVSSLIVKDKAEADVVAKGRKVKLSWNNTANTHVFNYYNNNNLRTTIYYSILNSDAITPINPYGINTRKQYIEKRGIKQECNFKIWNSYINLGIGASHVYYYTQNDYPVEFMGFGYGIGGFISLKANVSTSQYETYFLIDTPLIDKFLLSFGTRMDYLSFTKDRVISPRIRLTYSYTPKTIIFVGWGYYYQFQPFEYLSIDPTLIPNVAKHYIIGIEKSFRDDIKGGIELYDKKINNLCFIDVEKIEATTNGYGFARGIELFLRKSFTDNFFGWISCALSKAKRTGLFDTLLVDFDADRPFVLNLIGVYNFMKNITLSITYRHATGAPYTPVVGYRWDDDDGEWIPVGGVRNSRRYPPYNRVDVRVEKRFYIFGTPGIFYFCVFNLFQHRNVQIYVHEGTERQPIYMMPRLPFIGIKFEW